MMPSSIRFFHQQAMNLAEKAHRETDPKIAANLFKEAYRLEAIVCFHYFKSKDKFTKAVMYLSAGNLALRCNDNISALSYAKQALETYPVGELANEIKELIDKCVKNGN